MEEEDEEISLVAVENTIIPASADRSEVAFGVFVIFFRRFSHILLSTNSVSWQN